MYKALDCRMYVLPVRKGGLGNQMFQVAAAMIYAKETNRRVILPKEFYNLHNPNQTEYGESIFREIIHRLEKPIDELAIHALLQQGFVLHPGEPGFEEWSPQDLSGHVILHGYFQSYPPIQRHESTIRSFYLNGLGNFRLYLQESKNRVGIHIRRGDYLKPPYNEVLPVQTLDYYKQALSHFQNPESEFYIFSDDLDWCKQQELFETLPRKRFVEEPNDIKALAIMTTCLGGMICANSTFSWWGAFLGAYSIRSPVVVPRNWFRDGVGNLFPLEWIVLGEKS
jgi:hypothetical protein